MTAFLQYDQLTWPEVHALPRRTPLVIPLGTGYSLPRLADALGNPDTAYLLPTFPYGWQGSGLAVSETVLESYLSNLIAGLMDDGFTNAHVLLPQGLQLSLSVPWLALPAAPSDHALLPPLN